MNPINGKIHNEAIGYRCVLTEIIIREACAELISTGLIFFTAGFKKYPALLL